MASNGCIFYAFVKHRTIHKEAESKAFMGFHYGFCSTQTVPDGFLPVVLSHVKNNRVVQDDQSKK